jgi:hypothetical protein
MPRRISISTPAVGSSRISKRGSCTSARAIIRRRFMPPDSMRPDTSRLSQRPSSRRYFSARSQAMMPRQAVVPGLVGDDIEHLLEQVEVELLRHDADVFLGPGEVRHRYPHRGRHTCPAVLATSEQMMPIVVDLPAPLGPSSAKKSPCCDFEAYALERLEAVLVDLGRPSIFSAGAATVVGLWHPIPLVCPVSVAVAFSAFSVGRCGARHHADALAASTERSGEKRPPTAQKPGRHCKRRRRQRETNME